MKKCCAELQLKDLAVALHAWPALAQGGNRCEFRLISAGATSVCDFTDALRSHRDAWNIRLKDSEGPDSGNLSAALCQQYGIDGSFSDSIFWMVEMMESWFHALATFYGDGFHRNALKPNPNVEEIPKKDLEDGLKAATRRSQKGEYHKLHTRRSYSR